MADVHKHDAKRLHSTTFSDTKHTIVQVRILFNSNHTTQTFEFHTAET
jgi:hypothetical protein